MVTETELRLKDGRTLHAYDTGADGTAGRLTVFWHHGTPNIGAPPSPFSRPRLGSAFAGCRTTGPDMADLLPTETGMWHPRPPMFRASPTR